MYIAYMTSRDSSCINLLDLNCQWLDISKSHILVYCLFGYLRYKCRSVVLYTAEPIEQLQNPVMGVTINNESTTTESPP